MSNEAFVIELYDQVPALRPTIDEHKEYFGELLSHVLMGDVTRWAETVARRSVDDAGLLHLLGLSRPE